MRRSTTLSNATVMRVEKTSNYTMINNQMYQAKNMSLHAKGLLSVMLSVPKNWDFSIRGLAAICKEKEDTIKTVLKELKELGFVEVKKHYPTKENGGRIRTEYIIRETSVTPEKLDLSV